MRDSAFGLLGLAVALGGHRLGFGTLTEPGPGFVPVLVGWTLVALSALQVWVHRRASGNGGTPLFTRMLRPALLLFALALYVAILDSAGYVIATFVLQLVVLRLAGIESLSRSLAVAAIAVAVSYTLFDRLLGVTLPGGPFAA